MSNSRATEIDSSLSRGGVRLLLAKSEVANLIGVTVRTIERYEEGGLLVSVGAEGGHRRYLRTDVARLLAGEEARKSATSRDT